MKADSFCLCCDGNPKTRCRDNLILPSGDHFHFLANMSEEEAFAKGLATSGKVRLEGEIYHAYRIEKSS